MSILFENPEGRMDIAVVRGIEVVWRRHIERAAGMPLWDRGLGELVERVVVERLHVPSRRITLVDVARELGVLPRVAVQRRRS